MRTSSLIIRSAIVAVAVGLFAPLSPLAQTFSATTGTDPVAMSTATAAHTMKAKAPKNAESTLLYGRVRDGVYTVDGMVAKIHLNYDVDGAQFLYLFVPGVGTAVVSPVADPEAVNTEAKLQANELKFSVGEHRFTLTGVALATGKGHEPDHLYVKLDRSAWKLSRHAMMGFGNAAEMPYQWPGALAVSSAEPQTEESQLVPPPPASLLPSTSTVTPVAAAAPAAPKPVSLRPVAMQ